MEWWQIAVAVGGGFIAGIINTLAGNGSAITLTILTEVLGLPGNLANGTNRIGVFSQTSLASYSFIRNGQPPLSSHPIYYRHKCDRPPSLASGSLRKSAMNNSGQYSAI